MNKTYKNLQSLPSVDVVVCRFCIDRPYKMQDTDGAPPSISHIKPTHKKMGRNAEYVATDKGADAAEGKNQKAETKKAFGDKIRSLLNDLSMNQSDLARASGIPRDSISTYVRGKTWPDPANLRKIARALGVLPNDLIPGTSELSDIRAGLQGGPPTGGTSMEEVSPGKYRFRFDQVMSLEDVTEILAILKRAKAAE